MARGKIFNLIASDVGASDHQHPARVFKTFPTLEKIIEKRDRKRLRDHEQEVAGQRRSVVFDDHPAPTKTDENQIDRRRAGVGRYHRGTKNLKLPAFCSPTPNWKQFAYAASHDLQEPFAPGHQL